MPPGHSIILDNKCVVRGSADGPGVCAVEFQLPPCRGPLYLKERRLFFQAAISTSKSGAVVASLGIGLPRETNLLRTRPDAKLKPVEHRIQESQVAIP